MLNFENCGTWRIMVPLCVKMLFLLDFSTSSPATPRTLQNAAVTALNLLSILRAVTLKKAARGCPRPPADVGPENVTKLMRWEEGNLTSYLFFLRHYQLVHSCSMPNYRDVAAHTTASSEKHGPRKPSLLRPKPFSAEIR